MRLKCISSQALDFVRNHIVALPSESALYQNFRSIICTPGLLYPAYEYLREIVSHFNDPLEKLGVLMFDEMKLSEHCESSKKIDAIFGPNAYAQQIYISSLIGDWALPFFTEFDKAMTKKTLFDIIKGLETVGIEIVYVTCDQGGSNQNLQTQLGITPETPYFVSESGRKIFLAPDFVHVFKSLR